ncbi:MAG: DUF948 domain-containing protein [Propionibacteriaceae bacterium]|jgi:uncharacterized protein YoxC|nr:DUF948 domain-containing protein [Propionibacteriaceae bacterium]MDR1214034.1 DUF948 domain-containing protein [Propionibacteriaceae bacterium]
MDVTLGGIAGLIAAIALLLLVGAVGLPLIRLSKVMDELRRAVKEVTDSTIPVIAELEGTVTATNQELGKLAVVTEDVAQVSGHVSAVAGDAARVSRLVADTVAVPFIKLAALGQAAKRAWRSWKK